MDALMSNASLAPTASEFLSTWAETFNADKSKLTNLYAPEASLHGTSSEELLVGRDRIQSYFHGGATVEVKTLRCSDLAADMALLVGHYLFSNDLDGKPIRIPARFTFILQRENDNWQILHHHSSATPG